MQFKNHPFFYYLIPILIGIATFFYGVGPIPLNPEKIAWLNSFDFLQSYLGWAFFRQSPWDFPIGLNLNYGLDLGNSIVYSDSIPILAFFFKAIAFILPRDFQYFGIWLLMCFMLQAIFAWKIVSLFSRKLILNSLTTAIILISPLMIWQLHIWHLALAGHFIILAALYLNLVGDYKSHTRNWIFLIVLSLLVHFYLFIIVFILWIANLFDRVSYRQISLRATFIEALLILAALIFMSWQAGYFLVSFDSANDRSFGLYPMNLLAPFDPREFSYFIDGIKQNDNFEEGFHYLGLGGILLCCSSIPGLWLQRKKWVSFLAKRKFLLLFLLCFFCLALTHQIRIGTKIFNLPLPHELISFLGIIRCSGRMFWPVYYSALIGASLCVIKYKTRNIAVLILGACLILQLIDIGPLWLATRNKLMWPDPKITRLVLKNNFWNNAINKYSSIQGRPPGFWNPNWDIFGNFAAHNKMSTNIVLLARVDSRKLNLSQTKFDEIALTGNFDKKTIYIFDNWKLNPDYPEVQFNSTNDLFATIDGFNILAPGWKQCQQCPQLNPNTEMVSLTPKILLSELIYFNRDGLSRSIFLSDNGWGWAEDWGTWSISQSAKIIMPIPLGGAKSLMLSARAYIDKQHPQQILEIWYENILLQTEILTKFDNNKIQILLPKKAVIKGYIDLELKFITPIAPKGVDPNNNDSRLLGIGLISAKFL